MGISVDGNAVCYDATKGISKQNVEEKSVVESWKNYLEIRDFTILLGTMYPLMLDIFGLEKISVGVPYYNAVFLPLMIPLVFLAGYIPILFSSSNRNLKSQAKYFLISFFLIIIISSFSILLL